VTALTYANYLRLEELLSLQQVRVPSHLPRRVRNSENFFIVVHQSCELWLSQLLMDLDAATDAMTASGDHLELALEHLERVTAVLGLLNEHVAVLSTLPAPCFAEFRSYLGTASGAQSARFRQLDRMLGNSRIGSPVGEVFSDAAARAGYQLVDVWRAELAAGSIYRVARELLDIGQAYWQWKINHLALVSRLIGEVSGTGGTGGASYLARRTELPFPQLREAYHQAYYAAADDGSEAELTPEQFGAEHARAGRD
jgi:tryptophan 2,3-dioxygenase